MIANKELIKSSFRDPSAYCYTIGDDIYRKINDKGLDDYNQGRLMAYHSIVSLLKHQAFVLNMDEKEIGLADIEPERDLL